MSKHKNSARVAALLLAAGAMVLPSAAAAVDYGGPGQPSAKPSPPKGPHKTIKVYAPTQKNKKAKRLTKIQTAVNKAKAGDTIKIGPGTYKEMVVLKGKSKRYIRLIGDPKHPNKVVIDGRKKFVNCVWIQGADGVTVNGMTAKNYLGNGFFARNVNGYNMTNLRAMGYGVYGLYAFNSIGGRMTNSVGAYNNDSGFYVGQTPVQPKPVRTILKNLTSYVNVLGYSGTNSRYVTISDSKFYNNGAGIVPNALDSEKWPPAEDNVFTRNEIFWNNFNYYKGAPFKVKETSVAGEIPFPVGVGILLFGGRGNEITGNKIYGNWLVGATLFPAVTLKKPADGTLKNNEMSGNTFGVNGTDLNGVDIAYPGDGSGNCFGDNPGATRYAPALTPAAFPGCQPPVVNVPSPDTLTQMFQWALDKDHEAHWVRGTHVAKKGITPLEHYTGPKK